VAGSRAFAGTTRNNLSHYEPRYTPSMRSLRAMTAVSVLLLLAMPAAAKKQKAGFVRKPGTAQMRNFSVAAPAFECSNWAWAAATESILALDQVAVDQRELVRKAFGGELCVDSPLDLEKMGKMVAGIYPVNPKLKRKVEARVIPPGGTISAEALLAGIMRERPMIVFWKSRAYVAIGAAYDEWIGPNGMRLWEVRELTLFDPVKQTTVTFQKGRDDVADLGGAMDYVTIEMREVDWLPTIATPTPK